MKRSSYSDEQIAYALIKSCDRLKRDATIRSGSAKTRRHGEPACIARSRIGGAPNRRRYSRLNCDGLS